MSFHLYFFAIFFRSGIHPWFYCAHISSAARESFKRVHDWCKAGWHRPGTKSWLRRRCQQHKHPWTPPSNQQLHLRMYLLRMPSSLPVRRVYNFDPNIPGWKRPISPTKTRRRIDLMTSMQITSSVTAISNLWQFHSLYCYLATTTEEVTNPTHLEMYMGFIHFTVGILKMTHSSPWHICLE